MPEEYKKVVDWEDFRRHGHELVDYIADYYRDLESLPVQPDVHPGFLQKLLPPEAPESSESFDRILGDFHSLILPGASHWQHPNFFAYFPANSSPPAIFAEMLSKMLASMSFSWSSNPSSTELEQVVMDWLAKALHLPSFFHSSGCGGGVIQAGRLTPPPLVSRASQGSASESTLVSILAARQKSLGRSGASLEKLRFYCSEQSHSSVLKGLMIAGVQKSAVHVVSTAPFTNAVLVSSFVSAVESDENAGLIPCFASFNLGSTSCGVVDPLESLGKVCASHDIWLHLDGAYAGSALLCDEYSDWLNGMEYLSSFVMNPHKWLLTNFDCSAMWVRDRRDLFAALSITPEYLRTREYESGQVQDYRDWQIQLGRSIRSLKLWFVMRYYGLSGLRAHIRSHVALAHQFCSYLASDTRFELGSNELNERFYTEFDSNHAYELTHSKLHDQYVIRFVSGSPLTEPRHVSGLWDALKALADKYSE